MDTAGMCIAVIGDLSSISLVKLIISNMLPANLCSKIYHFDIRIVFAFVFLWDFGCFFFAFDLIEIPYVVGCGVHLPLKNC